MCALDDSVVGPRYPSDVGATVILGNDGPTNFRGNERGEGVQYQHSHDDEQDTERQSTLNAKYSHLLNY